MVNVVVAFPAGTVNSWVAATLEAAESLDPSSPSMLAGLSRVNSAVAAGLPEPSAAWMLTVRSAMSAAVISSANGMSIEVRVVAGGVRPGREALSEIICPPGIGNSYQSPPGVAAPLVPVWLRFETSTADPGVVVSAETTMSKKSLTEPPLPSLAVTCTETVCAAVRRAREGARGGGEAQPRGQRGIVGLGRRVGQRVAVRVVERVGRNRIVEHRAHRRRLVRYGVHHRRGRCWSDVRSNATVMVSPDLGKSPEGCSSVLQWNPCEPASPEESV